MDEKEENMRALEKEYSGLIENMISSLEKNGERYITLNQEALGGPEPAVTDTSLGGKEKRQIKNYSRHPYGKTIIDTYTGSSNVITIVDGQGEVSPFWNWWRSERMAMKFKKAITDSAISGVGFLKIEVDNIEENIKTLKIRVLSPKTTTTFSTDIVNNEYSTFSIEQINLNGRILYLFSDNLKTVVFEKNNVKRELKYKVIDYYFHGFSECPVIPIYDIINSDGTISSTIEKLLPVLQTVRLVTTAASEGAYWQGKKQLIIENVDPTAIIHNIPEYPEGISQTDLLANELNVSDDNSFIILPTSGEPGQSNPTIAQTQEANLMQLDAMVKQAKNTVAALSALPLQRLDPTATPQTAEGSAQSYLALDAIIKNNQENYEERIFSIYKIWASMNPDIEIDWDTHVIWGATNQASYNSIADTVAKFVASGIPIRWIVDNYISKQGWTPAEIADLRSAIEAKSAAQEDFNSMMIDAGNS